MIWVTFVSTGINILNRYWWGSSNLGKSLSRFFCRSLLKFLFGYCLECDRLWYSRAAIKWSLHFNLVDQSNLHEIFESNWTTQDLGVGFWNTRNKLELKKVSFRLFESGSRHTLHLIINNWSRYFYWQYSRRFFSLAIM